jgi:hypothetical protein
MREIFGKKVEVIADKKMLTNLFVLLFMTRRIHRIVHTPFDDPRYFEKASFGIKGFKPLSLL